MAHTGTQLPAFDRLRPFRRLDCVPVLLCYSRMADELPSRRSGMPMPCGAASSRSMAFSSGKPSEASVESNLIPARRTLRHVSLPASHIQRLTSFPSVKRERSALDKRPDCGFTKKGGCPATGVEKQVVGFAYLRQSGNKFLHAGFRNAYRQWPREPIRFAAKAPYIDKLYSLNFSASFTELDQLHDFRL